MRCGSPGPGTGRRDCKGCSRVQLDAATTNTVISKFGPSHGAGNWARGIPPIAGFLRVPALRSCSTNMVLLLQCDPSGWSPVGSGPVPGRPRAIVPSPISGEGARKLRNADKVRQRITWKAAKRQRCQRTTSRFQTSKVEFQTPHPLASSEQRADKGSRPCQARARQSRPGRAVPFPWITNTVGVLRFFVTPHSQIEDNAAGRGRVVSTIKHLLVLVRGRAAGEVLSLNY